jgi:hypothetical protein
VSDLDAAMQAALDSVDADRRRRPDRPDLYVVGSRAGVRLRDDDPMPPVVGRRSQPATFTEALREQYGATVAAVWTGIREAALLLVLFWVAAILLAFVEVEGAITIPGVGDATVITVALVVATALRGVLAAARRSGEALEARSR